MPLVVHAIDYRAQKGGSFIAALQRLTQELSRRGFKSVVVAPAVTEEQPWTQTLARSGVEILKTNRYREIVRVIKLRRPSIVHAHFSGYVAPATIALWATNARLIWHVHSAFLPATTWLRKANRTLKYRILSRRADTIVAVSEQLRDDLVALGTPRDRLVVVSNGIDTQYFREPSAQERGESRRSLGVDDSERLVLFFGRDLYVKGADVLALALEETVERPTIVCVDSPPEVVALMSQRTRAISTGVVSDPRPLYWAADAIVLPSRYEGAPLTLLEARATGLPAIVSAIPAFKRLVSGDDGIVVAEGANRRTLGAALMRPPPRESISEQRREAISLDRWCEKILAHYAIG